MYIKDWFKSIFLLFLTWLLCDVPNTHDWFCSPTPLLQVLLARLCLWLHRSGLQRLQLQFISWYYTWHGLDRLRKTIKYTDVQDNEAEDCSLLGCNIVECGRWLPVFWSNIVPPLLGCRWRQITVCLKTQIYVLFIMRPLHLNLNEIQVGFVSWMRL